MAKFAANNHVDASTGINPFFADYGFHLGSGIELLKAYKTSQKVKLLKADQIVENQETMAKFL